MKTILKMRHFASLGVRRIARLSAEWLNEKAEMLNPFQKKIALVLFCILFTGISAYIIQQALVSKAVGNTVFVKRGYIPPHIGKPNNKIAQPSFTASDFARVESIKKCLDSISVADKGRYAEIMKLRPHILDSIRLLETFYLQNLKK